MDFYRSAAAKVLNKPESEVIKSERAYVKHLCPPLGISPTNTGAERGRAVFLSESADSLRTNAFPSANTPSETDAPPETDEYPNE